MKTDDVVMAGLAFAAVMGLGLWYRQRQGVMPATVTQPLQSVLLPAPVQSIWSNPLAMNYAWQGAAATPLDIEDAEMGAAMRAQQPGWSGVDQEDADWGMHMRGIF